MRHNPLRRALYQAALIVPLVLGGAGIAAPAQAGHDHHPTVSYEVTVLPSLGGRASAASSINNRGWVAGFSNLPGDQTRHATLWRHHRIVDLGTLGGPNSSVAWPVKNTRGMIAGIAETAQLDPLGEAWSCSVFFPGQPTGHTCLGFVWKAGRMRALPTLGGNNGFAAGVNQRGQVVGWAENTVHDPTCNPPQVLQFRAVVWGPRGRIRELPPLPGDTVSAATALNDRGRVVGISGSCDNAVGRFSARHAVRWERGKPTDLGSLGGSAWHTPMAVNQRGEVVGFSNLPGDEGGRFNAHAVLWSERGGITDLGTLPGDTTSQALGINSRRQVVGLSCGAGGCRAFLWKNGVMTDLNALVASAATVQLSSANDINDAGEITGEALDQETGNSRAFTATPIHTAAGDTNTKRHAPTANRRSPAVTH
jgi:probable HAF family extracellular repeat protein